MSYIPVAKREGENAATVAYVPVSKRTAPVITPTPAVPAPFKVSAEPAKPLPFSEATPNVFGTAFKGSTTPSVEKSETSLLGILKDVGQQTASNIASAGLTVAKAIDPTVDGLKADDIQSAFGKELFRNIFGEATRGGELRSIEDRIAEAEPKVEAWKKELQAIYDNPDVQLSPTERFVTRVLGNIDANALSFGGIVGSVGLDLTPVGGLQKNLYKKLIEEVTEEGGVRLLKSIGVEDNLAQHFGLEVAKVKTEQEAKKLFAHIAEQQATTRSSKAGVGSPQATYTPVAERGSVTRKAAFSGRTGGYIEVPRVTDEVAEEAISKELEPLAVEARKYKTAEEFVEAQSPIYHGTNEKFDSFDVSKMGTNEKNHAARNSFFFTDSKSTAKSYGKNLKEVYSNFSKPVTIDAEGKMFGDMRDVIDEAVLKAKKEGNDAVIIKNLSDRKDWASYDSATHIAVFEPEKLLTKSQLTDFYNSVKKETRAVQRKIGDAEKVAFETLNPPPKVALSPEARATLDPQGLAKAKKDIEEAKLMRSFSTDAAESMSARTLKKYESQATGELPGVSGMPTKIGAKGKLIKNGKFGREGDGIVQEAGFDTLEDAQKALDDYNELRVQIKEADESIRAKVKNYRDRKAVFDEVVRYVNQEGRARREKIAAVQEFFKLTEDEMKDLIKGQRDVRLMSDTEFENFMKRLEGKATEYHFLSKARAELAATIFEKELIKVDNIRKVMKLPKIENMSVNQLTDFNELMETFKQGDEFLSVRKLETVDHTNLKGIRTLREGKERLVADINKHRIERGQPPVTIDDLNNIKVGELDRYKGDTTLSRQNPLFDLMVQEKNEAFLTAEMRVFEAKERVNELFKAARQSRKKGLLDRLIPTDNLIFQWLESTDADKLVLAKNMTQEELDAGMYIRDMYGEMRDYLVQQQVLKKFRSDYVTHVRRGFLEAWKEEGTYTKGIVSGERSGPVKRAGEGLIAAFKENFNKYLQDEATFNILDQATDQVLPLEKFFQFSMKRTGELVPSKNVAKAFTQYLSTFEKKKALDSIIPKFDIYVHSLTPKRLTPRGLEFDSSLKKFFKEWMNTKKGRATSQALIKPGGRVDWAMRTGVALTRLMDLGFSIPVGLVSNIGAQISTYRGLGEKAYLVGQARMLTPQGRKILNKYQFFTGEPVLQKAMSAEGSLGDNLMSGVFGLFSFADRKARQVYLLGKMTPEEFAKGEISIEKLARIKNNMGRNLPIEGSDSIIGKTAIGKTFTQYKSWALPLLSSTADDLEKLGVAIKNGDPAYLKSPEFAELLRTTVISAVAGLAGYGLLTDKKPVKEQSFAEKIAHKAAQDALSTVGALDPTLWSASPRLSQFVNDLFTALKQIVLIQTNKDGELSGVKKLKSTLTPGAVRQVLPKESAKKKSQNDLGLPQLPELPPVPKLPKLPKLPVLPKI